MRLRIALASLAVSCAVGAPVAQARPGDLDPAFGSGGIVNVISPDDLLIGAGTAIALLPDGRILGAGQDTGGSGSVLVERFTSGGQPDPSFGKDGVVLTDVGLADTEPPALVLEPDGRFLVAGRYVDSSNREFAVVLRYLSNGSLDGSFGSGGEVVKPGPGATSMALDGSGRIVVGTREDGNVGTQVFRLLASGGLDNSFGSGGTAPVAYNGGASSLAIDPDGRIVIGGGTVIRLEPNGAPDDSFGDHGAARMPDPGGLVDRAVVEGDGRIVATATAGGPHEMRIARLMPDGTGDPSFGSGGAVAVPATAGSQNYNPPQNGAHAIAVQPDGSVVAAGGNLNGDRGAQDTLETVRLTPGGQLDPAFGDGGKVLTAVARTDVGADSIAIQPDGRVLVAGYGVGDGTGHIIMARYMGTEPGGASSPPSGPPGGVPGTTGGNTSGGSRSGSNPGGSPVRLRVTTRHHQMARSVRIRGMVVRVAASRPGTVTLLLRDRRGDRLLRRAVRVRAGRPRRVVLRPTPRVHAGLFKVRATLVANGKPLARAACAIRLR